MFTTPAYAQAAAGASQGFDLATFAPIALMIVVFYFLLFRPQQRKAKEHKMMLDALRRGDKVVTGGGIIGTVVKVGQEDDIQVEIAENVRVRVLRSSITNVLSRPEPAKAEGPVPPPKADAGKGGLLGRLLGRK